MAGQAMLVTVVGNVDDRARAGGHVVSAFDHSDIRASEPHVLIGPEPAFHYQSAPLGA